MDERNRKHLENILFPDAFIPLYYVRLHSASKEAIMLCAAFIGTQWQLYSQSGRERARFVSVVFFKDPAPLP